LSPETTGLFGHPSRLATLPGLAERSGSFCRTGCTITAFEDTLPRRRQGSQDGLGCDSGVRQSRTDLFAKAIETLLLRQENETVPQPQHSEGRARSKTRFLTELLGNGELSLFSDLRGCQIFELARTPILKTHWPLGP
jgi:hypothetical protein